VVFEMLVLLVIVAFDLLVFMLAMIVSIGALTPMSSCSLGICGALWRSSTVCTELTEVSAVDIPPANILIKFIG
jgi:hypothetical protein